MALASCGNCDLQIDTSARVCPRCGAADPTGPRRSMAARWLGLIAAGVGLLGLGAGFVVLSNVMGSNTAPVVDSNGPLCDSAAVSAAAKSAIESAPVAKAMHVRALEFRSVRELQYDAVVKRRSCSAVAVLNSGEQALNYTAEWTNDRPPHVWVQIDYQK